MDLSKIMSYIIIITVLISCDDEVVTQNHVVVQFEKSIVSVAENAE